MVEFIYSKEQTLIESTISPDVERIAVRAAKKLLLDESTSGSFKIRSSTLFISTEHKDVLGDAHIDVDGTRFYIGYQCKKKE